MDFEPPARSVELAGRLRAFIDERVVPAQSAYDAELAAAPGAQPAAMEDLKAADKSDGLVAVARRELRRHNQARTP